MDQELKAAVDAGFAGLEQKLDTKLQPLTEKVTALDAKLEGLDKQAVRFDATGKQFKWPGGEAKAPAFIRRTGQDSQPLMIVNYAKAGLAMDKDLCKEERAFSERLRDLGYNSTYDGCIFWPFYLPSIPEGQKALKDEIRQRTAMPAVDWGEVAWHLKKHPDLAEQFGLTRKDMAVGDDALGAALIPVNIATEVIDFLRASSVLMRAGASERPLPPGGNIAYPRLTSDPSFVWTDPDTITDATTSNVGTGAVRLQAKSLRGFVTMPNDLIRYGGVAVEALIRAALGGKAAQAEDQQYLEGVGSSLAPKGILNYPKSTAETPTTGKITLHAAATVATDGDTLDPKDIRLIQALYESGNDPDPATGWILRPLAWAGISNSRADAITAGDQKGPFLFLTAADQQRSGGKSMQDVPVFTTTQASHNRVKGSASDLDYILYGNFRRLIIGRSGVLELAMSDAVKFLQDKTVLRAVLRADTGLEHEESFVITDFLESFLP